MSSWFTLRSRPLLASLLFAAALPACGASTPTYVTAESAPRDRTITVGGTAKLEVLPDEACIEMTIAAHDPQMTKAHAHLQADVDPLLAELRAIPGLVVEPGAIRYSPEHESDAHGASHLVGYAATAQINVRAKDFGKIPDVVGRAAGHGLGNVDVVYYSTQMVARKAELRARALDTAREKASAMAKTLGVSLGDVVTITEGDTRASAGVGMGNYLDRGNVDATSNEPAAPGAIPLIMSVGVVYHVK